MKNSENKDPFTSASEAFKDKKYKKSLSYLNKFKRLKKPYLYEQTLLEARINKELKNYKKALLILQQSESLLSSKKNQVTSYNLTALIYDHLNEPSKAVSYLEKSIAVDGSIMNAHSRYTLLKYYVDTDNSTSATKVGRKLLNWQQHFKEATLLLIKASKDKETTTSLANALINQFDDYSLDQNQIFSIFNKLTDVIALKEAEILLNKQDGTLIWHEIGAAVLELKKGNIVKALSLYKLINNSDCNYSFDFYNQLKETYFLKSKQSDYFNLINEINDKYFNITYLSHYISFGELRYLIQIETTPVDNDLQYIGNSSILIAHWILGNIEECNELLKKDRLFLANKQPIPSLQNTFTFYNYINKLIKFVPAKICQHSTPSLNRPEYNTLFVIGESHSLTLSNKSVMIDNNPYHCVSKFIMAVQMHHLTEKNANEYTYYLNNHLKEIGANANLLFTIGEIDCRINTGITKAAKKLGVTIKQLINKTVSNYLSFIKVALLSNPPNLIFIQGIPAPNIERLFSDDDLLQHTQMIKEVNDKLKEMTLTNNWVFIDVYSATSNKDNWSNGQWHLDEYHLKPTLYDDITPWIVHN